MLSHLKPKSTRTNSLSSDSVLLFIRVALTTLERTRPGFRDKHYRFGTDLIQPLLVSTLTMRAMGPHELLNPKEDTRERSSTWHRKQGSGQYQDFNEAGSSRRAQGFCKLFPSKGPFFCVREIRSACFILTCCAHLIYRIRWKRRSLSRKGKPKTK